MRKLIILRGLPGSGKSHLAAQLIRSYEILRCSVRVCSADDFFLKDGIYTFEKEKLGLAHTKCRQLCEIHMNNGVDVILIDNTNTQAREAKEYVRLATQYHYNIELMEPKTPWKTSLEELKNRNTHGVGEETLQAMLARWEDEETFKRKLGL